LAANWLVRVAYVFSRSTHLGVDEEFNPYVYVPGSTKDGSRLYASGLGPIFVASSAGNAWYNSMQLTLQKRLSHGFTIAGNYTWSKSLDDVPNNTDVVNPVNGSPYAMPPQMQGFQNLDRGPSEFDYEQHFTGSYVWQLPGLYPRANRFVKGAVNGWDLTGILTLQSGGPITVLAGNDRSLTGIGLDRAVLTGQQPYSSGPCANTAPCVSALNPLAFALPPLGTFGTIGKGSLRGPGIFNWDMEIAKMFPITERVRIQFRVEYFNIFNHANFMNPAASFAGAGFGNITAAADPRIAQMAFKVYF
jgi:hypothetical protein